MAPRHVTDHRDDSQTHSTRLSRSVQLVLISSTLLTGCQHKASEPSHVQSAGTSNLTPQANSVRTPEQLAQDCSQPDPAMPEKPPCEPIQHGPPSNATHPTSQTSHVYHHHSGYHGSGFSPLSLLPMMGSSRARSGLSSGLSQEHATPGYTATSPSTSSHASGTSHVTKTSGTSSHSSPSHTSTSHVSSTSRGGFGSSSHAHSSSS